MSTDAENAVDGLSIFETARSRWLNVTEIITLLTPWTSPLSIATSPPKEPPPSGTLLLYDRSVTRNYKADGYQWIRKRNSTKVREDHVKLRVGGQYRVAGCYVHSSTSPTFHRRAYHLLNHDGNSSDDDGGVDGRVAAAARGSSSSPDPSLEDSLGGGGGGVSALSLSSSVNTAIEDILDRKQSLILLHYLDTEQAAAVSAKFSDRIAATAGSGRSRSGGRRRKGGVRGGNPRTPLTPSQRAAFAARQLQEEAMAAIAAAAELQEKSKEVAPPPPPPPPAPGTVAMGGSDAGGSEDMKSLVGEDDEGGDSDPSASIVASMFGPDGGLKAGSGGDGDDGTLGILWDMVVEDEDGDDDDGAAAAAAGLLVGGGGSGGGAIMDPPTTGIHQGLTPIVGDSLVSTMEKVIKEAHAAASAGKGQMNPVGEGGITGTTAIGDTTLEKLGPAGPGPPGCLGAVSSIPAAAGSACSTPGTTADVAAPATGPSTLNPDAAGLIHAAGPAGPAPTTQIPALNLQDQIVAQQHQQQQQQQQQQAAALNAAVVLGQAAATAAALGGASATPLPSPPGQQMPAVDPSAVAVAAAASHALTMAQTTTPTPFGQDLFLQQQQQQQLQVQPNLQQGANNQVQLQQQQQQSIATSMPTARQQEQLRQMAFAIGANGISTAPSNHGQIAQVAVSAFGNGATQQINNVNAFGTAATATQSPVPPAPSGSNTPSPPPPVPAKQTAAGQVELPEVVDFTPAEAPLCRPGEKRAQIVLSTSGAIPEIPPDDAICRWVGLAAFVEISPDTGSGAPPVRHVGLSTLRRLTPFSCKCDVPDGAGVRPGRRSIILLCTRLASGTDPICDAVSTAVALYLQARWNAAALDGQHQHQPPVLIGNAVVRPTFYGPRPDAAAGAGGAGGNVQLLSQLSQQMFTFLG